MIIYSTLEVVDKKFPKEEDFRPGLELFERECILPFVGREVYGAFAYGSINRDDFNIASDIDYCVVITDIKHKKKIRKATEKAMKEKNVSLQVNPIEKHLAENGLHMLESGFQQHLEFTAKKYSYHGKNPLEVMANNGVDFKTSLRHAVGVYLSRLNRGYCNYTESDAERLKFFRDIMEKPWHAMRTYIQFHLGTCAPDGIENYSDTKSSLLKTYRTFDPRPELLEDIEMLRSTGRSYLRVLEEARNAENEDSIETAQKYNKILDSIFNCYWRAFHFIEQNALLMKS
jgi:hypothetical protein